MTILRIFLLGGLFSLSIGTVWGLDFRVISWQGSLEGLYYVSSGRPVTIRANEQSLSARYRVTGVDTLDLFREVVVDGQARQVQVGAVAIPQGMRRAILVLAPGQGGRLGGVWLNDNRAETGKGNFVFHNLASLPVALKVGEETQVMRPQARWVQPFGRNARSAQVMAAVMEGETPRHILNNELRVHPEYRVIFIFRNGRPIAQGMSADAPVEFLLIYDQEGAAPEDEEMARTSDQVGR